MNITHKVCFYKNCNITEVMLISIIFVIATVFVATMCTALFFNFPINLAVVSILSLILGKTCLGIVGVKKQYFQPGYLFVKCKSTYKGGVYTGNKGKWTNKR